MGGSSVSLSRLWVLEHDGERFYQSELVGDLPNRVRTAVPAELQRLVETGMLELEEPEDGQRRRYFRRTSSPLWAVISATADALEALKPEEEAQPAPVARRSKATIAS